MTGERTDAAGPSPADTVERTREFFVTKDYIYNSLREEVYLYRMNKIYIYV